MKELCQAGGLVLFLYAVVWGVLGWFFLEPVLNILAGIANVLNAFAGWLHS
jgi:hypothetical protein